VSYLFGNAKELSIVGKLLWISTRKVPFYVFFLSQGTVNGAGSGTFPSKGQAKVTLHIDENAVTFAVDDVKQEGSWPLPEEVFLLCDPYHTGSTVLLS